MAVSNKTRMLKNETIAKEEYVLNIFFNHYKQTLPSNTFKSDFIFVEFMKRTNDLSSTQFFYR